MKERQDRTINLAAVMGFVGLVLIMVSAMKGAPWPFWALGTAMIGGSLFLTAPTWR